MDRLFINGAYAGLGRWVDEKSHGDYTVDYVISGGGKRPRVHAVKRVFLKPEGGTLYEEETTVTFERVARSNLMKVTVAGAQGSVEGAGYWFERHCHYEIDVAEDNHLEFTFASANVKIDGVGSATNKGNFTSWQESVTRVG
jgi:hypothetical protein